MVVVVVVPLFRLLVYHHHHHHDKRGIVDNDNDNNNNAVLGVVGVPRVVILPRRIQTPRAHGVTITTPPCNN